MRIGILTFSHSDNYGAMLQAYGLKSYICSLNNQTFIIPYAPSYLVGRHWLIPYIPQADKWKQVKSAYKSTIYNLSTIIDFHRQRKRMKAFRNKYLTNNAKSIKRAKTLNHLKIDYLIVGSDQIWNPDITLGLRKEFFGVFSPKISCKVIAYAASIGNDVLPESYREEIKKLLENVDIISIRERSSIPYISSLTSKQITDVMDPIFLLSVDQWKLIESIPCQYPYILVYVTESNQELNNFIQELSKEKNLPIIQIKRNKAVSLSPSFKWNACTGPSDFLGYIHYAQYVVTNSFHATAFSILFHKQFLIFNHSSSNARLKDLLFNCNLENRIFDKSLATTQIDNPIDWNQTEQKKEKAIRYSKEFLQRSLAINEEI